MKNRLLKLSATILLLTTCFYSQENPDAILFDEFDNHCSEDMRARYDGFIIELQNTPNSKGYVIFKGEISQEGINQRFDLVLKSYPKVRGFDKDRIVFIRGENIKKINTQFWIVQNDSSPPKIEKLYSVNKIISPTRFQKTFAEFNKNYGNENEFYDSFTADWGCDFAPNLENFAEILKSDNNLTAYLIVYGSKTQSKKKIQKFVVKELTKTYRISKKRIKTIYGKKQEESQIELWFVPKGSKPPKLTNN